MNLQVEPLDETHEVRLTVGVDNDVVEKARRAVLNDLSKQVRIPGFRPGKAPMNAVIGAVGAEHFGSELTNKIANDVYPKALDAAKIEPYSFGAIEDVKNEPFQLVFKVPLEPQVDLKDYKSVRLPFPDVYVSDEEVEQQLMAMREDNVIVETVEREVQLGDMAEGTIVGNVEGEDGEEEAFRNNPRRAFVVLEDRMGIPGLAALLVGMKAGDHEHKQLTFPDDYENEKLRGKTAEVHLDVTKVSSRTLPEADDALAQTVSSFNTLAELRDDLTKRLLEVKTQQANREYANQALDAFAALADVKMPPAFVEDRLKDLVEDVKQDIKDEERMPFDEWLKVMGKTEEQFRDDNRETAKQRGLKGLVMRELGKAENLNVSDNEIASEVEYTAMRYGQRQKEVRRLLQQEETRSTVKNNILTNKVLARMVAIARVRRMCRLRLW
ncbi:MAG: trigger factor [Anaerolineae bacterium]|nr:trigger factor [Anaerolineae bacterium]